MKALLALVLLASCAAPATKPAPAAFPGTCPEGVAAPALPRIVSVERLRQNRDATESARRETEHARAVCAARLRRAAAIINELRPR